MLIYRKLNSKQSLRHSQRGMTLMELLIGGVISLIASSGMLMLMVNTLGTGTQTIKMARLTQDMRATMQIMTRELRRANYLAGFMNCFGHPGCLETMDLKEKIGAIHIADNGDSDCFWFWYDRPQSPADKQKGVNEEPVAAFRRTVTTGLVGKIQMTTSLVGAPVCNSNTDWVDITDPAIVDVVAFNVSDAESITETINTSGNIQHIERIGLVITARLTNDNATAARELREFVNVRNNTTTVL